MATYKHVDYQQNNIISIDMVAIYYLEMMELIKQKLNKLHQNCKIHMVDIRQGIVMTPYLMIPMNFIPGYLAKCLKW